MRSLAALALAATAVIVVLSSTASSTPALAVAPSASASADPVVVAERAVAEPRGRAVAVRAPTPTETPTPATPQPATPPSAPIVDIVAAVAPDPSPCPATFFCYPRLGIVGPVVLYNDCSGTTDIGAAIRQLTCVREGIWLAGHAYTRFGGITAFRVGDVVFVHGQRFEITGSAVQRACLPSTVPVAPLSLQTSLEAVTCGRVLVVQGR